jgi:hypothetical protein
MKTENNMRISEMGANSGQEPEEEKLERRKETTWRSSHCRSETSLGKHVYGTLSRTTSSDACILVVEGLTVVLSKSILRASFGLVKTLFSQCKGEKLLYAKKSKGQSTLGRNRLPWIFVS